MVWRKNPGDSSSLSSCQSAYQACVGGSLGTRDSYRGKRKVESGKRKEITANALATEGTQESGKRNDKVLENHLVFQG